MAAFQVTIELLAHQPTCIVPDEGALTNGCLSIPEASVLQVRKLRDTLRAAAYHVMLSVAQPLHHEEQFVLDDASRAWLPVRQQRSCLPGS